MKAAGLNAVSVYTHCKQDSPFPSLSAFHSRCLGTLLNPSPGVTDFDGFRDLQPLFDAAKEAGIFIVLRPGALGPLLCVSYT